ncbi:DUF58 domain-containing protein [Oxalicibacterium sp.]|uniref:DUF58 domain-containing protein n=1 Tax=Oxalicibacterium sp. TaxID=2766525 RepID=UPI002D7FE31D|nr:DUF58 domain-containing protein [Oxalicibacterium sp.]
MFRLRDAEPGEVFLGQRRVFILPTRAGLMFGLMLAVLFVASINYNLSLGFALTFLLAGCAVIDMHLTHRNLAHLYLSPGRAAPVFAGEEAQFLLHVANRRHHDRFAILLNFIDTATAELEHATDIAANAVSDVTLGAPTLERGWMPAPRIRLQTRFPLGLMRAWSYWHPDMRVLVYPHPEDDAPPLPLLEGANEDGRGSVGHDDFAGIRAYQSGDSLRQLAWRQIARTEGSALITKQFEGGATSELSLDFARLPRTMDVELKLSRMARWVLMAEERGQPYAFRLDSLYFPPASGPAHQAACLQTLALYGQTT